MISTHCLREGEEVIILERLRELLDTASSPPG
jgi:hypothetical protein